MLIIIMCTCFNKVVKCVTGRKMSEICKYDQHRRNAKLHSLVSQEKLMRTLQWALLFSQRTADVSYKQIPKTFYFLRVQ